MLELIDKIIDWIDELIGFLGMTLAFILGVMCVATAGAILGIGFAKLIIALTNLIN